MTFIKENNENYVVDWQNWLQLKKELVEANFQWSGHTPIRLNEDDIHKSDEIFVIRVYDNDHKLICKNVLESLTSDELKEAVYCLDDKLVARLKRQFIKKEGT